MAQHCSTSARSVEAMRPNAGSGPGGFLLLVLLFLYKTSMDPVSARVERSVCWAAAAWGGRVLGAVAALRPNRIRRTHRARHAGADHDHDDRRGVLFHPGTAVVVALVGGRCAGAGKIAKDAIVQREIGEDVCPRTFGVVERMLQIAGVFGGLLGRMLSCRARPGRVQRMAVVLGRCRSARLVLRRRQTAPRPPAAPGRKPRAGDTKPLTTRSRV